MWIIQCDTNFTGNAQSCFWAQVISSFLCLVMVPSPFHHPQVFQTWVPRSASVELMAVALSFHFILSLGLGLFSREGSLCFYSTSPCFPVFSHKHPFHWDISQGTSAEKTFKNQHLCLDLWLETRHNFGFTSQEELLVARQALGSASHNSLLLSFLCLGSSPWFCLTMFSLSIWQVISPLKLIIFKCLTALRP